MSRQNLLFGLQLNLFSTHQTSFKSEPLLLEFFCLRRRHPYEIILAPKITKESPLLQNSRPSSMVSPSSRCNRHSSTPSKPPQHTISDVNVSYKMMLNGNGCIFVQLYLCTNKNLFAINLNTTSQHMKNDGCRRDLNGEKRRVRLRRPTSFSVKIIPKTNHIGYRRTRQSQTRQ